MIHVLPQMKYSINTEKTPEEIYAVLSGVTDQWKVPLPEEAVFIGAVHPLEFKVVPNRNGRLRNSFIPVIKGKVHMGENGSVIEIKMRLHMFVRVFLAVWFGVAGYAFLGTVLFTVTAGLEGVPMVLFTGALFLAGQVMVRLGFSVPAKRAMEKLEQLLH